MRNAAVTPVDEVERYVAACNEIDGLVLDIDRLGMSIAGVAVALRQACPPGEGALPERWPDERRLRQLIAELEQLRTCLRPLWNAIPLPWRGWLPHPSRVGRRSAARVAFRGD
jgi:hypothetical protein